MSASDVRTQTLSFSASGSIPLARSSSRPLILPVPAATLRLPREQEAAAPAVAAQPLVMWNRLRILACVDVVSFHLAHEHAVAAIGLPLALVVSFALGTRHGEQPPLNTFLHVRLRRLVQPWAFWSAVYAGLLLLIAMKRGDALSEHFNPMMLFYGTMPGLWFLPAMAVGGVLAYLVDRVTRRVPFPAYAAACCLLAGILLLPATQISPELAYPIPQWRFALTAFPLGLLLGRTMALRAHGAWKYWLLGSALVAITVLLISDHPAQGNAQLAVRYSATVALLSLGAMVPNRPDPWTKAIEPLLLGIYLLHFVLYEYVVRVAFAKLGLVAPALLIACTLALNGLVVWAMRQTAVRRFV